MNRILLIFGILVIWLFAFPQKIFAQVVINEFSSGTTSDWVELYNTGSQSIDLSTYILTDSGTNTKNLQGTLNGGSFISFSFSNWLNNSTADAVKLFNNSALIDSIYYGSENQVCFAESNNSIGRYPDGNNTIDRFLSPTRDLSNNSVTLYPCPTPTPTFLPTPSPTPTLTPSPTPTPTPTKAVYKINKSKDDSGSELSSVQIHVDGTYVHHEDDEILEFYPGNHTISLRKSGYSDWNDTRNFEAGTNIEVSPVLIKKNTASPSPTITASPKPTPKAGTPAPSPTLSLIPSPTFSPLPSPTLSPQPEVLGESTRKPPVLAFVLVGSGIVLIGVSGFLAYKMRYNNNNETKN